jgi:hypothetical protein
MLRREVNFICSRSKKGDSLAEISELLDYTEQQVKEILGQFTGLTPKELDIVYRLKHKGCSLDEISEQFIVDIEVLRQFLPNTICRQSLPSEHSVEEERQSNELVYYSGQWTNKLWRTDLITGQDCCLQVPLYEFDGGCLSELPGRHLLVTGGVDPSSFMVIPRRATTKVVKINVRTLAVTQRPPMHTARIDHTAVYYNRHVYVVGGKDGAQLLGECERYVCAKDRWEDIPPLPRPRARMGAVVVLRSLYAMGGSKGIFDDFDSIQRLNFETLTWELLDLTLPHKVERLACFQYDNQVHFVLRGTLYTLTSDQVQPVKTLCKDIKSGEPCHFSRGTLYYTYNDGPTQRLHIGSLN